MGRLSIVMVASVSLIAIPNIAGADGLFAGASPKPHNHNPR